MTPDLHRRTPALSAFDPRGLAVATVAYHRRDEGSVAEARIERQVFDAAGRRRSERDARLGDEAGEPNQRAAYSLSGRVLRTESVDAGWRMALAGDAGQVLDDWDGRGTHRQTAYDGALRPVSVQERMSGEPQRCVERLTYGGTTDTATNRCGRVLRHDDPAGSRIVGGHGLLGQDLAHARRFLDALETPDWPESEAGRDALLETDETGSYVTRWAYDALGMPIRQTDAAGNEQTTHRGVAGQLSRMSLRSIGEADVTELLYALDYNAFGQVTSQTLGNGVVTTTTCSGVDGRLQRRRTSRPDKVLQDSRYAYDPVGNVVAIEDDAQPTDWFNGEEVDAISVYRYDTLYQLIEARGRESAQAGIQPGLPVPVLPGGGDASRRRNYTQTYTYDAGGNLLTLGHTQAAPRKMKVDEHSNRSLPMPDESRPPDIERAFDVNGNLQTLEGAQAMAWDARNQLRRVTQVARETGANDDEIYIYRADGQRCRKRRTWQAKSVTHVAEVKYLPGLEIRTNTVTGEVLHVVTAQGVRHLSWRQDRKARSAPQLRYSIDDHLGGSSLELDDDARVISHEGYYPYGGTAWWAARSEVDAAYKTLRYSGKERDATGLYYYGFRYYAPWLQRWINPDPAGDIDGMNLFGFVRNNPMVNIDIDGRGLDQVPSLMRTHLLKWAEENYRDMPPDEWRRQLREKIKPHVSTGKDKIVDEIQRLVSHAAIRKASSSHSGASSSRTSRAQAGSSAATAPASDTSERAHQLMWKSNFRVFQAAAEAMLSRTSEYFTGTFDSGTLDTIRGFHGAQGIFDSTQGKNKGPLKDAVKALMKASPIDVAWTFNAMLVANASESGMMLYRGTAMSQEGFTTLLALTEHGGALLQSTRFMATSSDIDVARRFSRMDAGIPVIFHVRGWAQHMGGEAAESEHLFPYGAVFLVERLKNHEFRMTYRKSMRPTGALPY